MKTPVENMGPHDEGPLQPTVKNAAKKASKKSAKKSSAKKAPAKKD